MKILSILSVLLCSVAAVAQGALTGWNNGDCEIGGQQVIVQALPSSGTQPIGTTTVSTGSGVIASYPSCSVTVYFTGTTNKATIYANNLSSPTSLDNPFTANADGSVVFFVPATACYDVLIMTGTGPTLPASRTFSDWCPGAVGAGTVISVGPASQTVGSLLTITIANQTTTPVISVSLIAAPGYTVFGNNQATPSTGQYVSIVTQMLPFSYSGNTTKLATVTSGGFQNISGTPVCEDNLGNLIDTGCSNAIAGVTSFNTRTGAVTSQTGDYSVGQVTGAAPLASPAFSGTPTTPTPASGDVSTQVTNDQWVSTYFAVLASPAFTGIPTAPTAASSTNTTQIATTAFVQAVLVSGGFAPINSPNFTGTPTAPTASVNDDTTQIATDAFVLGQASNVTPIVDGTGAPGVSTLYARADHVHPTDNTRAPLNAPNFTGNVGLGTGALLDSTNSPGTNTWVLTSTGSTTLWAAASGGGAVSSVFTRTGAVTAQSGDYTVSQVTGAAPLASPALTGTPTAPTAATSTNTTQIATTAFVNAEITANSPVTSVFTRTGAVVAASGDYTVSQVTGAAPLASPTFTGTPAAPTASTSTNTTQLATTAFTHSVAGTLTFFGNTLPLTALADPTSIVDAAGNSIAFSSSSLVSTDVAGDAISMSGGAIQITDAGADNCEVTGGTFACDATVSIGGSAFIANSPITPQRFSVSGCGGAIVTVGFTSGIVSVTTTGSCAALVITMGSTLTSTNAWACSVSDETTANLIRETASDSTSATFAGTTVAGDHIIFGCIGF